LRDRPFDNRVEHEELNLRLTLLRMTCLNEMKMKFKQKFARWRESA
jgi:hypothetical protein